MVTTRLFQYSTDPVLDDDRTSCPRDQSARMHQDTHAAGDECGAAQIGTAEGHLFASRICPTSVRWRPGAGRSPQMASTGSLDLFPECRDGSAAMSTRTALETEVERREAMAANSKFGVGKTSRLTNRNVVSQGLSRYTRRQVTSQQKLRQSRVDGMRTSALFGSIHSPALGPYRGKQNWGSWLN